MAEKHKKGYVCLFDPDMLTANVSPRTRGPWRGMLPPTM